MFSIGTKLMNGSVFTLVAMFSSVLCVDYNDTNGDVKLKGALSIVDANKKEKKSLTEGQKIVESKFSVDKTIKMKEVAVLENGKAGLDGWTVKFKVLEDKDVTTKTETVRTPAEIGNDKYYCLYCKTAEKDASYFSDVYQCKDGKLNLMKKEDFAKAAEDNKSFFQKNWVIIVFGILALVVLVVIVAAVFMKSG